MQPAQNIPLFTKPLFLLMIGLTGLLISLLMFHTLLLHNDHVQILVKIHKLLFLGEWSHFGNRGTAVGYIPGSLMTAVTALPMKLYNSIWSAGLLIILSHIITLWFLLDVSRTFILKYLPLCLLLLFWLNPWRTEQVELYNPAYLFFFAGLHLWTGMKMKDKSWWITCLHVLSIGLCFQFHFSALILAITSLLLFYYRWFRVHWFGVALGIGICLSSLIPWAIAYKNIPELAITVADPDKAFIGRNFLFVYPILKAALYWVRYGSTYFARHIFTEVNFVWISHLWLRETVSFLFHSIKWVLAFGTMLWSVRCHWLLIRRAKRMEFLRRPSTFLSEEPTYDRFYRYLTYLFWGMLITSGLSPVEFNHWHLILCFPAVSLFISLSLCHRLNRWHIKRTSIAVWSILAVFTFHSIFAAFGSRTHSLSSNYEEVTSQFLDNQ